MQPQAVLRLPAEGVVARFERLGEQRVLHVGARVPQSQAVDHVVHFQAEFQPEAIILFGSHAYGTPRDDSDIDLLVIKKTRKPGRARRIEVRRMLDASTDYPPVEPIVMTPDEVAERLRLSDDFMKTILGKGRVLYDRAG